MFGGIPYAVPPIGENRLRPAILRTEPWKGTFDATRFGAPCIQNPLGDPSEIPDPEAPPPDESCLFLNIFTPKNHSFLSGKSSDAPKLPVMVYIHGGGLCAGAGSTRWYNATELVRRENVIVVTLNYRLGALGFLVTSDCGDGNGGMNGINDQIVALQFVQRHITSFGGDPTQVTVSGQSAGGYSVCVLMASPKTKGLFRAALAMSGPCIGNWGPASVARGQLITTQVLEQLNLSSVAELRSVKNASTIQWPGYLMNNLTVAPYFSGYFFDPSVLATDPAESFRTGSITPNAVIFGHTSKDGTAAFYGTAPVLSNGTDPEVYYSAMRAAWGQKASKVIEQYPLGRFDNSPQSAFVQADADAYVICPTHKIAGLLANAAAGSGASGGDPSSFPMPLDAAAEPAGQLSALGSSPASRSGLSSQPPAVSSWASNTYVYEFAHFSYCDIGIYLDVVKENSASAAGWACHGSDVPYLFSSTTGPNDITYDKNYCPYNTSASAEVTATLRSFAGAFVRSGESPNMPYRHQLLWPPYQTSPAGPTSTLRFSSLSPDKHPISVASDLKAKDCAFWEDLLGF
mmetsp:Transcript_47697/g.93734  ORF Transcript_47697/g.93734 Transcript_47697/m.93734 type:complete len:573 (-) Transcript_47697:80-1798(-)